MEIVAQVFDLSRDRIEEVELSSSRWNCVLLISHHHKSLRYYLYISLFLVNQKHILQSMSACCNLKTLRVYINDVEKLYSPVFTSVLGNARTLRELSLSSLILCSHVVSSLYQTICYIII